MIRQAVIQQFSEMLIGSIMRNFSQEAKNLKSPQNYKMVNMDKQEIEEKITFFCEDLNNYVALKLEELIKSMEVKK